MMSSVTNDTLSTTPLNVTPIVLPPNVNSTQHSNPCVLNVIENVTVALENCLEQPSQANVSLANLTASLANIGVNNISSYLPFVDELRILALGLNFIPEPKDISNFEIYQALDEYTDSILWKKQLDYVGSAVHRDTSNSVVA